MENKSTKNDSLKKTQLSKKKMLEALTKTLGVVTTAAKAAGIHRSSHYDWLRDDEEYRREVEAIEEVAIDFGESALHQRMNEGSDSAIIFFLKTKGKKRGYIERSEIDFKNRLPDFSDISTEELRKALYDEDDQELG